jgi:magnesium-transporting ATPase (P-type)
MKLSTMVFSSTVLMQVANAFQCRSSRESILALGPASNRLLVGAVVAELGALAVFVYSPLMRTVLGHHPLGLRLWLLVLVAPVALTVSEEARKALLRSRESRRRRPIDRADRRRSSFRSGTSARRRKSS